MSHKIMDVITTMESIFKYYFKFLIIIHSLTHAHYAGWRVGSNVIPRLLPVHRQDWKAAPGLSHVLHFFLHHLPPCDLQTTPPLLSLWCPVQGSLDDRGFLVGDMASPPPVPPH